MHKKTGRNTTGKVFNCLTKENTMKSALASIIIIISFYSCRNRACIEETSVKLNDSTIQKKKIDRCNSNLVLEEQVFSILPSGKLRADGYAVNYDKYGEINKKNYFLEDSLYGPQYYYQNGQLAQIEYFTQRRKKWLTLRFDNKGNVIYVEGKLLHITLTEGYPYFDSIPINGRLRLMEEVATVEKVKTILYVKVNGQGYTSLDTTITRFFPILNSYMTGTQCQFKKKGTYDFFARVTLVDSVSNRVLLVDSFAKQIVVY